MWGAGLSNLLKQAIFQGHRSAKLSELSLLALIIYLHCLSHTQFEFRSRDSTNSRGTEKPDWRKTPRIRAAVNVQSSAWYWRTLRIVSHVSPAHSRNRGTRCWLGFRARLRILTRVSQDRKLGVAKSSGSRVGHFLECSKLEQAGRSLRQTFGWAGRVMRRPGCLKRDLLAMGAEGYWLSALCACVHCGACSGEVLRLGYMRSTATNTEGSFSHRRTSVSKIATPSMRLIAKSTLEPVYSRRVQYHSIQSCKLR
jgi:hypothetical protein